MRVRERCFSHARKVVRPITICCFLTAMRGFSVPRWMFKINGKHGKSLRFYSPVVSYHWTWPLAKSRLFVRSLVRSLARSFVRSFVHSLTRSFVRLFVHGLRLVIINRTRALSMNWSLLFTLSVCGRRKSLEARVAELDNLVQTERQAKEKVSCLYTAVVKSMDFTWRTSKFTRSVGRTGVS